MEEPIYLDYQATTPVDRRVLEKMLPFFCDVFGNASSIDHLYGFRAKEVVSNARASIAKRLGCRKDSEIIFTSGATEANNLAIIGTFRKHRDKGNHLIASSIEHPAVLDTLRALEREGAAVTLLPVDHYGMVDLDTLHNTIRKETILISVMFANNEIGTIQPIAQIGGLAKNMGILFHVDAAQAVGHEPINVYDLNIDLLSCSAHKFYGPKGVGGLFVRSFAPMVRLDAITFGGGQERNLRPGTLNVPGIIGMAEALDIALQEQTETEQRLGKLAATITEALKSAFPEIRVNGHPERKLTHNLNLTIPGVEAKALIHALKSKLCFSAGSACSTTKVEPSHVLKAIGLSEEETYQTIRLGLGRSTQDAQGIADILIEGIRRVRR